ncbi:MAG: amidohydrolase family protein [Desulfobulbaceae bacterium]
MTDTTTYIHAGWLIDGSGGPARKDALLAIASGNFAAVGSFDRSRPPAGLLTDLSHCTLMPPLVDSHVHLGLSGTVDHEARQRQLAAGYGSIRSLIAQNIRHAFTHGVLAVRDGGDAHGHVLRYVQANEGRDKEPVIVKAAGRAWHQPGRYGSMIGRPPGEGETLAEAFARDADPVAQVKVINSGPNSLRTFARETPPQFDLAGMRELVHRAGQQGKKVMVHANGELPVRIALEAGCHSIEHGYFMGRENLALMAAQDTIWVPTLVAIKACAEHLFPGEGQNDPAVARRTLHHQLEQIALARELGVTIALGTDAGSIGVLHGEAVSEELRLLLKAGCTLTEAIRCATWNGAGLLGVDDQLGLIAPNRPAHFLAVRGTPSQLPRKVSYLQGIYLNGRPCPMEFFDKI